MSVAAVDAMPALFPFFGGKKKVAPEVWDCLGDVSNYVEPFAGSLAVLLRRPDSHRWWEKNESVNDKDCYISNFWRAITHDPDAVATAASYPVIESDLTARHLYLVNEREAFTARMMADPDFFDARIAGWWMWGIAAYIGADWCTGIGPFTGTDEPSRTRGGDRPGVYRKMPMMSGMHPGKGIHKRTGIHSSSTVEQRHAAILADCLKVADRLRTVRVACGDWSRLLEQVLQPAKGHTTGVFLDPPYDPSERRKDIYAVESDTQRPVHLDVRDWAVAQTGRQDLRIIYCGYSSDVDDKVFADAGWSPVRWKSTGGYGSVGENRARTNASREIMWCSPTCLNNTATLPLF